MSGRVCGVIASLALASAAPATGCGSDSSGGPGDRISDGDAQALCADFSAHSQACGWNGNVNAADWNCGEAAWVWRADVFRAFVDCALALPCDGDGQTCYADAFAVEPLPVHEDYAQTCEQRSSECALTSTGDASGLILLCDADRLAIYATSIVDDVIDCFGLACDAVVPCLEDAL